MAKLWEQYPAGTRLTVTHPNGMRTPGVITAWNHSGEHFYFEDDYGRKDWLPARYLA